MSTITSSVDCHCGRLVVLGTAWTNANPGRRWEDEICFSFAERRCGFFEWEDPPMCERARNIIPSLLRRINAMEGEDIGSSMTYVIELDDLNNLLMFSL
ncbi:UNVERIFIED_CONTAM: hypothetical protein Sradi_3228200 [Sesamum radiatum]|uniref:Zinc finger GRF-type domain-containing protein n=1 Tax=Sesamum radiatum TaxID=300843 RepID=A0AAW2RG73_SESRA